MKVGELIEKLNQFDHDAEVRVYDYEFCTEESVDVEYDPNCGAVVIW